MPAPFRPLDEMTPQECLTELAQLFARGVVRLCRRLLAMPSPASALAVPIQSNLLSDRRISPKK